MFFQRLVTHLTKTNRKQAFTMAAASLATATSAYYMNAEQPKFFRTPAASMFLRQSSVAQAMGIKLE